MPSAMIGGTGSFVPERVLTNRDLERMVDTSDEWIRTRTGIVERRIADPDAAASDLAVPACQRALEAAGVAPEEVDLVVAATLTPDAACPAAACLIQSRIGAHRAAAFDLNAACSGFIYGLQVADAYIRSGLARRVLVVATDIMSRVVNWSDRASCVLWGDGAGAALFLPAPAGRRGVRSSHVHAQGDVEGLILIAGGGSRVTPITQQTVARDAHTLKLRGPDTFKMAVRAFEEVCREALEHNGLTTADIDHFIPHQANLRILEAVNKRLGFPLEKTVVTLDRYGNMSSATVPVALDESVRAGRIRRGDLLLLAAFGGGFTWGAAVVEW